MVIDLRPTGRKGRLGLSELTRQVQQGCVPHRRRRHRPAQGRRAQGGSRAATRPCRRRQDAHGAELVRLLQQAEPGGSPGSSSVGVQGYYDSRQEEREASRAASARARNRPAAGTQAAKSRPSSPPLVSEFAGTFGGKPFNMRVVHSPRRKIEGKFKGDADDTEDLLADRATRPPRRWPRPSSNRAEACPRSLLRQSFTRQDRAVVFPASGISPPSSITSTPTPAIWLNALGISAIIGIALYLSVLRAGQAAAGSLDDVAPVPHAVLRLELLAAHQGQGLRAGVSARPARERDFPRRLRACSWRIVLAIKRCRRLRSA